MPESAPAGQPATGAAAPPRLDDLLPAAVQRRDAASTEQRRAAGRLNAAGDRAYRQGRYDAAFTQYATSYPTVPTAHALILAGDAHWRGVQRHQAALAARQDPGAACQRDHAVVAADLALGVRQHHELGLALIDAALPSGKGEALRERPPAFAARARTTAACLTSLASRFASTPDDGQCIGGAALAHCLGAPLLR